MSREDPLDDGRCFVAALRPGRGPLDAAPWPAVADPRRRPPRSGLRLGLGRPHRSPPRSLEIARDRPQDEAAEPVDQSGLTSIGVKYDGGVVAPFPSAWSDEDESEL